MIGLAPGQMPVKCRWFARERASVWTRAHRVMTISDYLTYALTGKFNGDAGTASLTGLFELKSRSWWPDALEVFGIRSEQLSNPLPPMNSRSSDVVGTLFAGSWARFFYLESVIQF